MPRPGAPLTMGDDAPRAAVWIASTADALGLDEAAKALDQEERRRADRFRLAADRERFLAGRALLRHALSQRTGGAISPADWRFRAGPDGKPAVAEGLPPVAFNLSHSGACVSVAVGGSAVIGVDVECALPDERLAIVADVLTPRERDALHRTAAEDRWARFIRLWTVKEACGKALGLGIGIAFTTFDVELEPLAVTAPEGILDDGQVFTVAACEVACCGVPYVLSAAAVDAAATRSDFCFKPLGSSVTTGRGAAVQKAAAAGPR